MLLGGFSPWRAEPLIFSSRSHIARAGVLGDRRMYCRFWGEGDLGMGGRGGGFGGGDGRGAMGDEEWGLGW